MLASTHQPDATGPLPALRSHLSRVNCIPWEDWGGGCTYGGGGARARMALFVLFYLGSVLEMGVRPKGLHQQAFY